MKYLSWALLPCFIAYAIYSLVYEEHKVSRTEKWRMVSAKASKGYENSPSSFTQGWYSYIVNMLAGGVYTFGEMRYLFLTRLGLCHLG